jgi:HEPN domain-containing protein
MVEMDREKHVAYWRNSASEDLSAARDLVARGHLRHGLFFLHLAVEKTLKGLVVHVTGAMPPKSHDLLRLAEKAAVDVPDEKGKLMSRIARHCLEGRYPDTWLAPPDPEASKSLLSQGEELIEWLGQRF